MLAKLIKYDLKFIYKQLIFFYIVMVALAIVARLTNIENPPLLIKSLHEFAGGACYGFTIGSFISSTMRTWARFKANLYGDESYLTHTLPVPRRTLWTAKFFTAIIIVFTNAALALLSFLIFFPIGEIDLSLPWMLPIALGTLLLILLENIFILEIGFISTILGHRQLRNRSAYSAVFGLVIYVVANLLILGVGILLCRLLNPELFSVLSHGSNEVALSGNFLEMLLGTSGLYIIAIIISYFVGNRLLAKGVDVD